MTPRARSRSANPPSGFAPLDPRLRRGRSLKASAPPPLLAREKPVKPGARTMPTPRPRPAIMTRAEVAPCTCPEHCERDHEND